MIKGVILDIDGTVYLGKQEVPGAARFVACTNAARGSYGVLKDYGFRAFMNGIVMMQRNDPGFHRPEVFALDDWR